MTSNDIYTILSSKPHNPHYLKRYMKFIGGCRIKNSYNLGYTEGHHICPKAKDLFPEYTNKKIFPWNIVDLTTHQHIIAHVILWKTFGGSQSRAVELLLATRNIPTKYALIEFIKLREDGAKHRSISITGSKSIFNGASYSYIKEFEDVPEGWVLQGQPKKTSTKNNMSSTRKTMKKISNGIYIKWILKTQDIPEGWSIGAPISTKSRLKISEKHKQPVWAKHIRYDSLEEACSSLSICYNALKKYTNGCVVNRATISKSPHFSIDDLGKNTNDLGWNFII
jgi:hypothetical protein